MGVYFGGLKLRLRTPGPTHSFLEAFPVEFEGEKEKRKGAKKDGDGDGKRA